MKKINEITFDNHHVDLEKNFNRELLDEDFKNYVASLDIPKEDLYKYTSILRTCVDMRKKCAKCESLDDCKLDVKGYVLTPDKYGKRIIFSEVPCSKMEEYLKTSSVKFYEEPSRLKLASYKNLYRDDKKRLPIIKYFKEFTDKYLKKEKVKGIYLTGSFGSGKTYMISALFNELAKKGVKSVIVYYPEFLRSLKSSFKDSYDERFEEVKKAPLLLIDDIGAENVTSWNRDEVLAPILQYRMDEALPTFFTSNLSLAELEEHLAGESAPSKVKARRLIERIKEESISIDLVSKNRRD